MRGGPPLSEMPTEPIADTQDDDANTDHLPTERGTELVVGLAEMRIAGERGYEVGPKIARGAR